MTPFVFHTPETAPAPAAASLAAIKSKLGFLPNLYAGLAEAPQALQGYLTLAEIYGKTSLTAPEQQVVLLAISIENGCEFCVGAHSMLAKNVAKLDDANLNALRRGERLPDARLNALATFARAVVRERGEVQGPALEAFLAAGFSQAQVLEVILGASLKTLSNYSNHVLGTPLNPELQAYAWNKDRQAA